MTDEYYSNDFVKVRILEFLGGDSPENASAEYITGDNCSPDVGYLPRPIGDFWRCLQDKLDIGRSLWDRKSLIAHLDLEHLDFDDPGRTYLDPSRSFGMQQPVTWAIESILSRYQIRPLHLLSGRGHHYIWSINQESETFRSLTKLGSLPDAIELDYLRPHAPNHRVVDSRLGAAYSGLSLVMEHLTHLILDLATGECEIPLTVTAVESRPGNLGREIISIDLSEYGDPLHTRGIRVPFSRYLKPYQQRWLLGPVADQIPPIYLIPLADMDLSEGLLTRCEKEKVIQLAERSSVKIPDQTDGMSHLTDNYRQSSLAGWHQYFYSQEHHAWENWPETYDRLPLAELPVCTQIGLLQPNDRLLKPAWIQHLVRVMLAKGWHPRHIAGLIRSRYERNCGWGDTWYRYNATMRADFYVRLFAGLIVTGRDALMDFTCRFCPEKSCQPSVTCNHNLTRYRSQLLQPSRWSNRRDCRNSTRLYRSR
jgi:hypothetical protein